MAEIVGTSGDDTLTGTTGDDTLRGLGGNDRLEGGDGNDTLEGGDGNDTLIGGAGANVFIGGAGDDILDGSGSARGPNTASYADSAFAVTVFTTQTTAQNTGGAGVDTLINIGSLIGSAFDDVLTAGSASGDASGSVYSVAGGGGADRIVFASEGWIITALLDGGIGDDTISYQGAAINLSSDAAMITGGAGADTIILRYGRNVTVDGGTGDDSINISGTNRATLTLGAGSDLVVSNGTGQPGFFTGPGAPSDRVPNGRFDILDFQAGSGGDRLDLSTVLATFREDPTWTESNNPMIDGRLSIRQVGADVEIYVRHTSTNRSVTTTDYLHIGTLRNVDLGAMTAFNFNGQPLPRTAPVDQTGDNDDNNLQGGYGADTLRGGNGADRLFGFSGDDRLFGDAGNDDLQGGDGTDEMHGGDGNDAMRGGRGDGVDAGDGADTMFGDAGDDTMYGETGDDTMYGGVGNDLVHGGIGADQLYGEVGADLIYGGSGDDFIDGGFDSDTILGEGGNDTILGGFARDLIEGGTGNDSVWGGDGDDIVQGESGDDFIDGQAGVDYLLGGDGNDILFGGAGVDALVGGNGLDLLFGDDGDDSAWGGVGVDQVYGGAGNDLIDGQEDNDTLDGGDGNDIVYGGAGNDTLFGGAGLDILSGEAGTDVLFGGHGQDFMYGGGGADRFLFVALSDSTGAAPDQVLDFLASEGDVIDVSAIDANTNTAGNQDFVFASSFTGQAGQAVLNYDANANRTALWLDVNGDGAADSVIWINGQATTGAGWAGITGTGAAPAGSVSKKFEPEVSRLETGSDGVQAVDLPTSAEITATRVASGLSSPLFAVSAPGDPDRLFVVEQHTGRIVILDLTTNTGLATPFLDLPDYQLAGGSEQGLLGLAFHPDYETNGKFYVNLTNAAGDTEVWEYARADANTANAASARLILSIDQPFDNHNGGWMDFGSDGHLYIATGDGGGGGDPNGNAQNLNSLLGKVLRIDVNRDDFAADPTRNYGVPADNPFVGTPPADEIWAYGLRNPWRMSFDEFTGDLYIADVGQGAREEVNLIRGGSAGGQNFGWDYREGTLVFTGGEPGGLVAPILEYSHGSGALQGRSITGGYVYHGPGSGQDLYFFGDFVTGNLWTVQINAAGQAVNFTNRNGQLVVDAGDIDQIASFAVDGRGRLYVIGLDGEIHRLTPSSAATSGNDEIRGTHLADTLDGGVGNDRLYGDGGNDTLSGGDGHDSLWGWNGNDTLLGGAGFDLLDGQDGDDTLDGGADQDSLFGGAGNDTLLGGAAQDQLFGQGGDDRLWGGDQGDRLEGGAGTDFLDGQADSDTLDGGDGDDVLFGGAGDDIMLAGTGLDLLFGEDGADRMWGGLGIDQLYGGVGADLLDGQDGDDLVDGGVDNDLVYGGAGADVLLGGGGLDILSGQDGVDRLTGGQGQDFMYGGTGGDRFIFTALSDSTGAAPDQVLDFLASEGDVIDVSAIDANVNAAGDQDFVFASSFTGQAGQAVLNYDAGANRTSLWLDVNGDGAADSVIWINGLATAGGSGWAGIAGAGAAPEVSPVADEDPGSVASSCDLALEGDAVALAPAFHPATGEVGERGWTAHDSLAPLLLSHVAQTEADWLL